MYLYWTLIAYSFCFNVFESELLLFDDEEDDDDDNDVMGTEILFSSVNLFLISSIIFRSCDLLLF